MALERWGTLSVRDHIELSSLVANVILYDRLVFPTPIGMKGVMEWREQGWNPELLNERLHKLGELAVRRPWDHQRQSHYQNAMQLASDIGNDADDIVKEAKSELPYQMTRRILAQEKQFTLPSGVTRVEVVSAFDSAESLQAHFNIEGPSDEASLALLLRHELLIPSLNSKEHALDEAIGLSMDAEFQNKRRDFYDWQDQLLRDKVKPEIIASELTELVEAYNRCVKKTSKKVDQKFGFMIGGVALSLAGAVMSGNVLPIFGAFLSFVSFRMLDGKPAIDAGRSKPAAMFHDAKQLFA